MNAGNMPNTCKSNSEKELVPRIGSGKMSNLSIRCGQQLGTTANTT